MRYALIILLCTLCRASRAQLPDYYVYLVSGNATIGKQGAKPITIKQKQLVYKTDVIVLKKETELILVDKNSSFLVLNKAGTYKASELVKNATKKNNRGVTAKYLELLFHELLDPHHDYEKFKKENIAGVRAGVSRGDSCGNRIFPVNGLKTSAGSILFKWYKTSPSSNYSFVIYNEEGKEFYKINVSDTLQPIDNNEILSGKPGKYFWRVISEDGTCEDEIPIYFHLLSPEKEKEQIGLLLTGTGNESLEARLLQIDMLEKNGFIDAASAGYEALVKADSTNRALRESYVLFLLKYGFDEEAVAVWK